MLDSYSQRIQAYNEDIPQNDEDTPQCILFKGTVEKVKKVKRKLINKIPCYSKVNDNFVKQNGFCKLTSTSSIISGKSKETCIQLCQNSIACKSFMIGDFCVCVLSDFSSIVKGNMKFESPVCYTMK